MTRSPVREYGKAVLKDYGGALFGGVEGEFVAWMSHGDAVETLPPGFAVVAATDDTPVAAMEDAERGVFCLQFHPEVRHTPKGDRLIETFLERTGITRDWTPQSIVDALTEEVRREVGAERVLLGISGGVDSSTLGLLLHHALG